MKAICAAALSSVTEKFCFGRMITKIGLVRIGVMTDLRAAKARTKELSQVWPGEYVIFCRDTGRVVAKASSESSGGPQMNKARAIDLILELSADAQIKRREVAKDSPAFHNLTGSIAAYGKALALLTAPQLRGQWESSEYVVDRAA